LCRKVGINVGNLKARRQNDAKRIDDKESGSN
jgi:hypothetical protein